MKNLKVKAHKILLFVACGLSASAISCSGTVSAPNSQSTTPGQLFTISGTVSPAASADNTVLTLSGPSSGTTTVGSTGSFSFTGLSAGTYAITPSKSGFGFNPTTEAATITSASLGGLNFAITAQNGPTFTISGNISPVSAGSGAAVLLAGSVGATATADGSGHYSFPGLVNGSYTVTPSKSGVSFAPSSQNETLNGANIAGVNFTATVGSQQSHAVSLSWNASTSTVSGYNVYRSTTSGSGFTRVNGSLLSGLTFSDSNVTSGTTYFYVATAVDSGGDESVNSNQVSAVVP